MWLMDRLYNRKIEGKSSLDALEPLVEESGNLKDVSDIVSVNEGVLAVSGDISSSGDVSVGGDASVGGATVVGDASVGGDLSVVGDASITGDAYVTGNINASGTIDGLLKDGPEITVAEGLTMGFYLSKRIGNVWFFQVKIQNGQTGKVSGDVIATSSYIPTSVVIIPASYSSTNVKSVRMDSTTGEISLLDNLTGNTSIAFAYVMEIVEEENE